MMMTWLGLLLVCVGVTENTHLYASLEQGEFVGLAIGLSFLLWSMRHTPAPSRRSLTLLALAPIPLISVFGGDVWPAGLLSLAALLALILHSGQRYLGLLTGTILASSLALVLAGLAQLYVAWSPLAKDLSILAEPVVIFLRFLGHEASLANGTVFVRTFSEQISHVISIDHILPLPLVLIGIGGALVTGWVRRRELIPRLALLFLLFVPIRYFLLLLAMLELEDKTLFWREGWMLASVVPLVLLFALFVRYPQSSHDPDAPTTRRCSDGTSRRPTLEFSLLTLSAFLGVLWMHWPEVGKEKSGRILIDEGHSDWEWTTEPLDTRWYGKRSTYNFYCLAKYLGYYYDVEPSHAPLSSDLLGQHDILVLKTPTTPYSDEEIDAVEKFVLEGGGLWLVGDHTNVFGTSTRLNPVAERFGLEFVYDVTYDLQHGGLSLYRPPTLEHPVVRHVQDFLFATSCSLRTSLDTQPVQIGTNLMTLPLDYAEHGFFPKKGRQAWESRFGSFVQTAAVQKGAGRVVAFSDSTCFSNFFMHVPGKPELAVGTMEWLNHRGRSPWLRLSTGILALLLLGSVLISARTHLSPERFDSSSLLGVAALLLGVGLGSLGVKAWTHLGYPWPEPHTALPEIRFEGERSRFFIPEKQLVAGDEAEHFLTFYVWSQRLGLVPRVEKSFQSTFEDPEIPVVLIRPQGSFHPEEVEQVHSFLNRGGRLLVLDDGAVGESRTNELLSAFGIELLPETPPSESPLATLVDAGGEAVLEVPSVRGIRGATPILTATDDSRTVVLAHKEVGRGDLLVCSLAYLFSGKHMGYTGNWPSPTQAKQYELEYWMLRAVASGDFSGSLDAVRTPPEYRQGSKLYAARETASSPGF